jgi:hypothetical protein
MGLIGCIRSLHELFLYFTFKIRLHRFYPEFNGIATFEEKDVYSGFLHKTTQFGGRMVS